MSNEPDPQAVREVAQEVANIALHDAVHVDQWISAVVNSKFGDECKLLRSALHAAVARRMAVVKPAWPAEQPHDAQPERDNSAPDLWWSFTGGADTCYLEHDDNGGWRECCMRAGLAYALEVRDQQVRTETQPERDADTRAIDAMIMASVRGDSGAMALAFDNVRKRWIGRIAKLDAREAKAGEQR